MGDPKEGASPPTWKLMLVKWLGLYPILVLISYGIKWAPIDPSIPVKLLITTGILVPLLNYVITPLFDSLFSDWLYKGIDGERDSTDIGA